MHIKIFGVLSDYHHPQIKQAIGQAIQDLPQQIRDSLNTHTFNIGQKLADIAPDMLNKTFADAKGLSFDQYAIGFYRHHKKTITMMQEIKTDSTCNQGIYEPVSYNPYRTAMHEIGHAFARTSPNNMATDINLLFAYIADINDIKRLPDKEREARLEEIQYYITTAIHKDADHTQNSEAIDEVFAEAFSNIIGGLGNTYDSMDTNLRHRESFPRCYAHIEQVIKSLAPDTVLYPNHNRLYPAIDGTKALSRLRQPFLTHSNPNYAAKSPKTAISTLLAPKTAFKFSAT